MDWADVVNGALEATGGLFILLSVVKLHQHKLVRGVSWVHVSFFAAWGYWNLYYYPHLDQWLSFWGGMFITVTNTVWMGQLIYYTWEERRRKGAWRAEREGNRWPVRSKHDDCS